MPGTGGPAGSGQQGDCSRILMHRCGGWDLTRADAWGLQLVMLDGEARKYQAGGPLPFSPGGLNYRTGG